jgi:hypothetical protein
MGWGVVISDDEGGGAKAGYSYLLLEDFIDLFTNFNSLPLRVQSAECTQCGWQMAVARKKATMPFSTTTKSKTRTIILCRVQIK